MPRHRTVGYGWAIVAALMAVAFCVGSWVYLRRFVWLHYTDGRPALFAQSGPVRGGCFVLDKVYCVDYGGRVVLVARW